MHIERQLILAENVGQQRYKTEIDLVFAISFAQNGIVWFMH